MDLYFKVADEFCAVLAKQLALSGYKLPIDYVFNQYEIFQIDTDNRQAGVTIIPEDNVRKSFINNINTVYEFEKLIRTSKNEELARFNQGKTQYSFIDFRLFRPLLYEFSDINIINRKSEEYLYELLLIASEICFDKVVTDKLQMCAYKYIVSSEGLKVDDNYINPLIFASMADVLAYGAKKYARNNWRKHLSDPLSIVDSMLRHIISLINGEKDDPESTLPHIGHIMCNIMFLTYHLEQADGKTINS